MNHFTIRDIENLTGIKAHTLRIWEQRYQLINPKRKEGNHRIYDNDDLKFILRVAYLYNNGFKISRIAAMNEQEIREHALKTYQENGYDVFVNQLMEASIDLDQELFEKVFHQVYLHLGFEKCMVQVIYPFLNKVGLLWLTGNVLPAQEHFASNMIRQKMIMAIDGLEKRSFQSQVRVLLFTPEGEQHEMPLLLIHYLLRKKGIGVYYLGVNISMVELEMLVRNRPVTHLYTHIITQFTRQTIDDYVSRLAKTFPAQTILLSGPVASGLESVPENIRRMTSLEDLLQVDVLLQS